MTLHPSLRTIACLSAALILSGCIRFGSEPPASLMTLTSEAMLPAGDGRKLVEGDAITVLPPRVPAALASNRIPVQMDATNIAYVKEAQWVESPGRLFRSLLSETIAAKTGRPVLDPRQYSMDPGIRISGLLHSFGIDAVRNEAVVIYDATRVVSGSENAETRRFEARVPVGQIEAGPVGMALNRAANQVAEQVATWIAG